MILQSYKKYNRLAIKVFRWPGHVGERPSCYYEIECRYRINELRLLQRGRRVRHRHHVCDCSFIICWYHLITILTVVDWPMNQADQFCYVCVMVASSLFVFIITVFDLPLNGMKKFMFYDGSFLFDMLSW